jgi:DNA adenine methylase
MRTGQLLHSSPFLSPLRYPGGKRKLAGFVQLVLVANGLAGGEYAEAYAGGAAIALALLFRDQVRRIHINDLDKAIFAFWHSVLNATELLCRLIQDTPVNMEQWHRQRCIQEDVDAPLLALGFSAFYLNRTNRSGIITGGVIGGKEQAGAWRLDARFNKPDLIRRIREIAKRRERICVYNMDAGDFLTEVVPGLPENTLCYLDPPYYARARCELYASYYEPNDHDHMARVIGRVDQPWIVSYDDVPETRTLYGGFRCLKYGLHYSAQEKYKGQEVMFFSRDLEVPGVSDPARLNSRDLAGNLI